VPAFWLTYKPRSASSRLGWPASELSSLVERFEVSPAGTTELWRIASHQAARPGDRVYLFKQGVGPRGIFGVGEIIEHPCRQADPTDNERRGAYEARISFDRLVDPDRGFLLSLEEISDIIPNALLTTQRSGIGVPEDVANEIERRLAPLLVSMSPICSEEADDPAFDPDSVEDLRERALRAIRIRRGQPAFRAMLLEAYGCRCVITGCAVKDVLEAAHITPYLGGTTNHTSNGLLLRADLHTLFDCGLLAIEPCKRMVVVAAALRTSSYGKIAGQPIRAPKNPINGPSKKNLEKRFAVFLALHGNSRWSG
jgi:putative restriction endonuclease